MHDYVPEHFSLSDSVRVFSADQNGEPIKTVKIPAGTVVFAPAANGFILNDGTYTMKAQIPFKLYLMNGSVLTINGVTTQPESVITAADLEQVLIKGGLSYSQPYTTSTQEYKNQVLRQMDDLIARQTLVTGVILNVNAIQEFTMLRYQVAFAPDAVRNVRVAYTIAAGYPSGYPYQQSKKSVYEYLLNPAKYWGGFNRLEIKVNPGPSKNDLLYSSIPLQKTHDGSYRAVLKSLPAVDLYLILGRRSWVSRWGWFAGIVIASAILAAIILKKIRKRKAGYEQL